MDTAVITATSVGNYAEADSSVIITSVPVIPGVELEPAEAAQTGLPGATLVYTLSLTNTGNTADTFDLSASGNAWEVSLSITQTTLGAGAGTEVAVQVAVPAEVLAGESDNASITATSQADPAASDSSLLTSTAEAVPGVLLVPAEAAQSGFPGETIIYTLHLTNTGNLTDTFELTALGNLWQVGMPVTLTLGAGAGTDMFVLVTSPSEALPGDMDVVTIHVVSTTDESVMDEAVLTSSVPGVRVYLPLVLQQE